MEPNPWSNYNQHYSRLTRSNVPPGSINRYDMPLLDQPGLTAGLGSLSSPLSPSHSALPTARPMASLTPMAYSHPLHNMPQFLDSVNTLPTGFTSHSSYKGSASVSQSAYPMDSYLASRVHHESGVSLPVSSPRYMPQHSAPTSPDRKPLFSPDLFSKGITGAYTGNTSSQSIPLLSSSNDSRGWGLSNFTPSSSAPFNDIGGYSQYPSPPLHNMTSPATHSTGRITSSSHRLSYPPDPVYSNVPFSARSVSPVQSLYQSMSSRPPSDSQPTGNSHHAHSSQLGGCIERSRIQEAEDLSRVTPGVPTTAISHRHRDEAAQVHDMYISKLYRDPYLTSTNPETPPQPGNMSTMSSENRREQQKSPLHSISHLKSSTPLITDLYSPSLKSSPTPTHRFYKQYHEDDSNMLHSSTFSSSPSISQRSSLSHLSDMKYDPVSPAAPITESEHGENLSTISLQDLHSISSHNSDTSLLGGDQQPTDYTSHKKTKQKKTKESKKKRSKSKSSVPSDSHEDIKPHLSQMYQDPSLHRSSIIHQPTQHRPSHIPPNQLTQHQPSHIPPNQHTQHQPSHIPHNQHTQHQPSHIPPNQHTQHQPSHIPHNQHTQHQPSNIPQNQLTQHQAPYLQPSHAHQHHQSTQLQPQSPLMQPDQHQKSPQIQYPQHPKHTLRTPCENSLQQQLPTTHDIQHSDLHSHQQSSQVPHQNQLIHYQSSHVQPAQRQQQPHLQHQNQPSQIAVCDREGIRPSAQHPQLIQHQKHPHHVQHHTKQEPAFVKSEPVYSSISDSSQQQIPSYLHQTESPTHMAAPYKQGTVSPVQQSPVSVASPALPSSTPLTNTLHSDSAVPVIQSGPSTIQAVADSTTVSKPKRGRGRKKKQIISEPVEKKLPVDEKAYSSFQDKLTPQQLHNTTEVINIKTEGINIKTEGINIKTEGINIKTEVPQHSSYTSAHVSDRVPDLLQDQNASTLSAFTQHNSAPAITANDSMNSGYFHSKELHESSPFICGDSATKMLHSESELSGRTFGVGDFNLTFEDASKDGNVIHNDLSNQLIDAAMQAQEETVDRVQQSVVESKTEPDTLPKAVVSELEFDDDFQHLAPSPAKKPCGETSNSSPSKDFKLSGGTDAFLSSFVNFISGKKGETLSSVTQSPIQRPPMPKYCAEPRRVKPESPVPASEETSVHNSDVPSSTMLRRNSTDTTDKQGKAWNRLSGKGKRKKLGRKLSSTSRVRKSQTVAAVRNSGGSEGEDSRPRTDSDPGEDSPAHLRRQSSRKAKEAISKRKYVEEDSDEDRVKSEEDEAEEVTYTTEEEVDYDSDNDPAWTPFAGEKSTREVVPSRIRRITKMPLSGTSKKQTARQPPKRKKISNAGVHEVSQKSTPPKQAASQDSDSDSDSDGDEDDEKSENNGNGKREPSPVPEPEPVEIPKTDTPDKPTTPSATSEYQRGTFLIEKRDLTNYENFPVWRVSDGKMLQKYELIIDKGEVKHRSTFTYSSWTPLMYHQFQPVQVKLLMKEKRHEIVTVDDTCRPKPPTDGSLERQYEDDPMVESFNVFLQILLSQALEPGFLKAIHHSDDEFYLGHMSKVDEMIQTRLKAIQKKVKWTNHFKEAVKNRPHVRELDRPNLKQSCQACKDIRQPAIKSVHLFGDLYDSVDLSEQASSTTSSSEEFLIGKMATTYLMTYHSLVHYKYNLYKRCMAKVNLVKESEGTEDNAAVLDTCLHNRAWVLKLFEDLKTLLEEP